MNKLLIYTLPKCPLCANLKKYFIMNNITFKEIDMQESYEDSKKVIKKYNFDGVPIIENGDKTILGLDNKEISEMFGIPFKYKYKITLFERFVDFMESKFGKN